MTPDELLTTWHDQQTAFIEFRDVRVRAMLEVLAALTPAGDRLRVLDLGCGPGSLCTAVAQRFADAEVVGLDRDPILLRLGRETNRFADRVKLLDVDLTQPDWTQQVGEQPFDAVVSATALHWLDPDQLVALYLQLPTVLAPGAVFLNADHLEFDASADRFLPELAEAERERYLKATVAAGAMSWDAWWEEALAMPGWEEEAAAWHHRWADKHPTVHVSSGFHLEALRAAGFGSANQVFQWFDDRVIFARLPHDKV